MVRAVKNLLHCTCERASAIALPSLYSGKVLNSEGRKPVGKPGTQWLDVGRRGKTWTNQTKEWESSTSHLGGGGGGGEG
jgi:hypothetical protein